MPSDETVPPEEDPGDGARCPHLALPGLREVYAALVREARALPELPSALQAELWTSTRLGTLAASAPDAAAHRHALADLVRYLREATSPGAQTFLRTLAVLAPEEAAAQARRAADERADAGVAERPEWTPALGRVVPLRCWLIQDGSLAGDRIVGVFRYADGSAQHALVVRAARDLPNEIIVVGDVPAMLAQVRQAAAAELCVLTPYDPAVAGRRLRAALDAAAAAPRGELPDDCYPALALARHRAAAL